MKKVFISTFLASLMVASPVALGANMTFYRKHVGDFKGKAKESREVVAKRVTNLRSQLGTQQFDIEGFNLLAGVFSYSPDLGRDNRFYSSFVYKSLLDKGAQRLLREDRNAPPISYNPAWSLIEHQAILKGHRQKVCLSALGQPVVGPQGKSIDGIKHILGEVIHKLIVPEQLRLNKDLEEQDIKNAVSAKAYADTQRKSVISRHLLKGPKNAKGQSIIDVMGVPVGLDIVNGLVQRVVLSRPSEGGEGRSYLPASLTMFINFRSGEDDYFVDVQQCLADFIRQGLDNDQYEDMHSRMRVAQPYIERKLGGAKEANMLMKKLSTEQVNYVIDMFLQLRGLDMFAEAEAAVAGENFALYEQSLQTSLAGDTKRLSEAVEQARADYSYYVGVQRHLTLLERTLDREVKDEALRQRDHRLIEGQ